nr:replication protein P [Pectobacterium aroidearum]
MWQAMIELYTDRWIAKNGAEPSSPWIAAIGQLTETQIGEVVRACIDRCAAGNTWPPDLAEFISLVAESGANVFGVSVDGVMGTYWDWRKKVFKYDNAEQYPWPHNVVYHICIEIRRQGSERNLNEKELRSLAAEKLDYWVKRSQKGIPVPPVRKALANTAGGRGGSMTPAQQMMAGIIYVK